eukprot:4107994-Alexandrium_andersonii.AAC.1
MPHAQVTTLMADGNGAENDFEWYIQQIDDYQSWIAEKRELAQGSLNTSNRLRKRRAAEAMAEAEAAEAQAAEAEEPTAATGGAGA